LFDFTRSKRFIAAVKGCQESKKNEGPSRSVAASIRPLSFVTSSGACRPPLFFPEGFPGLLFTGRGYTAPPLLHLDKKFDSLAGWKYCRLSHERK
jgi:hypothetical protein